MTRKDKIISFHKELLSQKRSVYVILDSNYRRMFRLGCVFHGEKNNNFILEEALESKFNFKNIYKLSIAQWVSTTLRTTTQTESATFSSIGSPLSFNSLDSLFRKIRNLFDEMLSIKTLDSI